ncbi:hypothetical protein H8D91_02170 [archaeon]|nr:hypothetical protein [archaeon]
MVKSISELLGGLGLILLGIFLISTSNKKCLSTFCKIREGPKGKIQDKDTTSILVGLLLILIGLLIVVM